MIKNLPNSDVSIIMKELLREVENNKSAKRKVAEIYKTEKTKGA